MVAFLDVQCYSNNKKKLLPVELAVVDSDFNLIHRTFYIPHSVSETFTKATRNKNYYVYKHIHAIPYHTGKLHVNSFSEVLKDIVYAEEDLYSKGAEKCLFLSEQLGVPVKNIEDFGEALLPRITVTECTAHVEARNLGFTSENSEKTVLQAKHLTCAAENAYYYRRLFYFQFFPF
jgi:hypothetical protein